MKQIDRKRTATFFAGIFMLAISTAAFAQYVWIDEKGSKQYSDMPPPASIPAKNILKAPGKSMALPAASATGEASAEEGDAAAHASATDKDKPMTIAEKNADYKKRKAEQAEKESKAADEAKRQESKKKNCERARQYQADLDNGYRITQTDAKGERGFMSDEQRSKEMQETRARLANCN